jgi:hypothetical protein
VVRRTDHWISAVQHRITGEMWRKSEMIDEAASGLRSAAESRCISIARFVSVVIFKSPYAACTSLEFQNPVVLLKYANFHWVLHHML